MNRYETALLVSILAFYFPAFGLYHFMLFMVNRQLPPERRIPHFLYRRGWNRLGTEYRGLYPRSSLYQLTLFCAVMVLIFATALLGFRFWEYISGK
jgi:hypothetical protein